MTWRAATYCAGLALIALPAGAELNGTTGTVDVTVTGVRSAKGHVLVAVCDRSHFLQESCPYHGRSPAQVGSVTVHVTGVPPGVYAAQAFQDENENGKVDRNLFGLPTEGIGFSNNAPMRFGPPSFDAAAFSLGPGGGVISFSLRYFD